MKITFLKSKSPIPLIRFRLEDNEQQFIALLDSGSELTFVDKTLADKNNIQLKELNNEIKLNQLSAENKSKVKIATPVIRIGQGKVTLTGMIMDLSRLSSALKAEYDEDVEIDAIIGSDFLESHNAKIDYEKKTFTMNAFNK